ncbi:MAG: 16S rRNA (uracil(1498)-N(3))-methyltransferase [Phenylobacterium sp.]|uniref:16S rRNA (uracil(1498)-N(3))-methyltransferase n=1 Tax=Phenylobacterium sp. TaxID=1871053 RepID=UPI001B4D6B21|nr:16S rRNA (uracil(1498)-N(3))-methyltransferase [Phenylobacterium sp.]MBP7815510.1 16S rRNA (uracil(1498)-N(3))-methyltransferase [Phenylobacterium sp.]MBP9231981.1 16S rRNA (uracil(1498)-N(3))-methyltransferase [Phenylobacterium sp.]MBP9755160.1 16S rRNA (uracil(1498)-N(3))-methyltransferase [Phenylobacterium sp.]
MIRLFVPNDLAATLALPLDDGQSRYLAAVMRQGVGDELLVFNGRDGEWRATIIETGKRRVILRADRLERAQAVGPDLDLVIAVVKRGRLETIVEKAAELGARRVRPILTERTNADRVRVDRLQAIAVEAAEQTGRLDVPEILEPVKLDRLLKDWSGRRLLFCDEAGDAKPVIEALSGADSQPWGILIGPEGGFSPAERERLRSLDFTVPATLGPRILRADTAAISAMTLWQATLGDW